MRAILGVGLLLVACSSSGTSDTGAPVSPVTDGGPGGGYLDGSPTDLLISADATVATQGRPSTLRVKIKRVGGNQASLNVTVSDLPVGVTAAPTTAAGDKDSIDVPLTTDPDASQQGDKRTATVHAVSNEQGYRLTAAVDVSVVGAPGALDKTFGSGGRQTIDVFDAAGVSPREARGIAVSASGSITVLLDVSKNSHTNLAMVRLKPNGAIDTSFGTAGLFMYSTDTFAYGLLQRTDGRFIIYGNAAVGGAYKMMLVGVTAAGALDSTFGGSPEAGVAEFQFDPASFVDEALDAKLITNGGNESIAVAGRSGNDSILLRFSGTGAPDALFNGGVPVRAFAGASDNVQHGVSVLAEPDGSMVLTSIGDKTSSANLHVAAYTATGASKFTAFDDFANLQSGSLAKSANDGILLASFTTFTPYVKRFDKAGAPDSAYQTSFVTGDDDGRKVAGFFALPSGGALLAVNGAPANGAALYRLDANGVFDPAFGDLGRARIAARDTSISAPPPVVTATTLDPSGRILLMTRNYIARVWN